MKKSQKTKQDRDPVVIPDIWDFKSTHNVSQFHLLPFDYNRKVDDTKHLNNMEASLSAIGQPVNIVCCRTSILEGVNRTYVLEGQYRITAITNLGGQKVMYSVCNTEDLDFILEVMMRLNNTNNPWPPQVFANMYRVKGYTSFKLLMRKWESGAWESIVTTAIIYGYTGGRTSKKLRDGSYQTRKEHIGDEISVMLKKVVSQFPGKVNNPILQRLAQSIAAMADAPCFKSFPTHAILRAIKANLDFLANAKQDDYDDIVNFFQRNL